MFSERFFHHVKFRACLTLETINEEMLTRHIDLFYKQLYSILSLWGYALVLYNNKYTCLVLKGVKDLKTNIKNK